MRRFIKVFLIVLCLSFNVITSKPAIAVSNVFKQGIYNLSDLNVSQTGVFTIQNVSTTEKMYLYILDENLVIVESIRLLPTIQKLDTIPLKPSYTVLIVGKGEVYLTSKNT